MIHRLRSTFLAVSAFSVLALGHAVATPLTTTSFSTWKTTLTGSPTEADFSAVQYTNYNTSSGLVLNSLGTPSVGFTVTGPDNGAYSLTGINYTGFKSLESGSDASASMMIATPQGGENALLFSLATTNSTPITISLSDGETFTANKGLFGLTLSNSVTSATLTTTAGSQIVLDDLWYGTSSLAQTTQASAAPEGTTLLMIAGGLLLTVGMQKRLRTASSKESV